MSCFAGPNIIESNLIFALDPGNTKSYPGSGSTFTDLTTNQIQTTLVGSPTYSTDNGGNFLLNGTSQYITLTWPTNNTVWSMSFWLNPVSLPGSTEKQILATTGNSFLLSILFSGGIWRYSFWNGSTTLLTIDAVQTGVWQNLVVTQAGTLMNWYLNGVKLTDHGFGATFNSSVTWIGNNPGATTRYLNARMSHMAFYDKVLTQAEIQRNFNALRGRFGI